MKTFLSVSAVCMAMPILAAASPLAFNIAAGDAEDTLGQFGRQSGLQVFFVQRAINGHTTQTLQGEYEPKTALETLLRKSGLTFTFVNDHTVNIIDPNLSTASKAGLRGTAGSVGTISQSTGLNERDSSALSHNSLQLAQSGQEQHSDESVGPQEDRASHNESAALQEVVVTAQKRVERLQDVPIPITAINTSQLLDSNQLKIQDYYTQVPSLTLSEGVQSSQQLVIRGLAANNFVDDLPIGGALPDIDPGNLQRIEVLRGPQGTLYGASGLGGVVKFITIDPSTDGISGRLEAGTNTVYNGYDLGYNTRGSINLPITSDLAVRAGAFWRQDAGYIDNPLLGIDGINRDSAKGGQLTALWTPEGKSSVRFTALYQEIQGGSPDSTTVNSLQEAAYVNGVRPTPPPPLGSSLEQEYVAGIGAYERMFKAFGLTLKTSLGPVNVTSVSGYTSDSFHDYFDYTVGLGGPGPNSIVYQQFGVQGAPIFTSQDVRSLSEELRFSGSITRFFDWTLGLYYQHTNTPFFDEILATNPTTGHLAGVEEFFSTPGIGTNRDVFSNFTFHVTDRFDIQMGGRESYGVGSSPNNVYTGPYNLLYDCGSYVCRQPDYPSSNHAFTYLFTPSYKFSTDLMLYVRLASAFVGGGINAGAGPGTPPTFGPEKTENYEVGLKGVIIDNALSFDASVYTINFVGLQNEFYNNTSKLSYTANAGAAVSRGIELSTHAHLTSDTNIDTWVVFSDAHLTDIPAGVQTQEMLDGLQPEIPGEPLPDSDRFSANLALTQNFSLPGSWRGFAGGAFSYIGQRSGPFTNIPQPMYPSYAKVDLQAGAKHEVWSMNLYLNNIADRRGIVSADNQATVLYNRYYIQPRTIGVSVARTF